MSKYHNPTHCKHCGIESNGVCKKCRSRQVAENARRRNGIVNYRVEYEPRGVTKMARPKVDTKSAVERAHKRAMEEGIPLVEALKMEWGE